MNMLTENAAIVIARNYAGFEDRELIEVRLRHADGYYEFFIRDTFMLYDIFVDAETGEVCGFDSEPVMPAETVEIFNIAA